MINRTRLDMIWKYTVALIISLLILYLKLSQNDTIGTPTPFLLLLSAVIVSSLYGGAGPGIFALILTALFANYFFLYPSSTFGLTDLTDTFQTLVYLFQGLIVVWIISREKSSRQQIEEANKTLETKVLIRTEYLKENEKELKKINTELRRSNKELEDFAYVASHDLQEPLRKIQSFSNLLHDEYGKELPRDAKLYLDKMLSSTTRMRKLIDDLLVYSRVATNRQPFKKVNLEKIVNDVMSILDFKLEETQGTVTVEKLRSIDGDESQLTQLLQNLVMNALRYRKENIPPKIHISGKKQGPMYTLYVRDNGIGFDEKYKSKIFNIFERLHGKGTYEGTGIGLAIVKKIVNRHKGSIDVISKPGQGSTFIVTLPIIQKEKHD